MLAGLTLDTFNRHADKVAMANIAQLVNCLQSLFLADGDRFITTPTYHVFAMHADHQGGQSLRTLVSAPRVSHTRAGAPASFWGLQGSASLSRSGVVAHAGQPVDQRTARDRDRRPRRERHPGALDAARVDRASTPITRSTRPTRSRPTSGDARLAGSTVVHTVAPASVTRIDLTLA